MQATDEMVVHFRETGEIIVEDNEDGVKGYKKVSPMVFIDCVKESIRHSMVSSGVLPQGCFSFSSGSNGQRRVCIDFGFRSCDITYEKTLYENFPIPRLVFGFNLVGERIQSVDLGVTDKGMLTPKTKMYRYPFSNVCGFHLCCGMNRLPDIKSLHQLAGVMHYIMSMPNNNDHFSTGRTKLELEYRELLETLKDKSQDYYYSDVLVESGKTLSDFIKAQ